MSEKFVWLLERKCRSADMPEYLSAEGNFETPYVSGGFGCTTNAHNAFHFSRRRDAVLFASAFLSLNKNLPVSHAVDGFLTNDLRFYPVEHGFAA